MGTWLVLLLAAVTVVGLSIAAMAIGVMFKRPCLRGSCGGSIACDTCPNRRRGGS